MAKIRKTDLLKYLAQLEKADVITEVMNLFAKYEQVQEHYTLELGSEQDRARLLNDYKETIHKKFFPARGINIPKASELRKIIAEFKKVSVFQHELVDLILYRVECCVEFHNRYGYVDEAFYNSMYVAFEDALKLMQLHFLFDHFRERCQHLIENKHAKRLLYWKMWGDHLQKLFNQYTSEIVE